jgi:hypothetical protein
MRLTVTGKASRCFRAAPPRERESENWEKSQGSTTGRLGFATGVYICRTLNVHAQIILYTCCWAVDLEHHRNTESAYQMVARVMNCT